MRDILEIIRERCSSRVSFNPIRHISDQDLQNILAAVQWAPTTHNMQNFEIIVIDDKSSLAAIGATRAGQDETWLGIGTRTVPWGCL